MRQHSQFFWCFLCLVVFKLVKPLNSDWEQENTNLTFVSIPNQENYKVTPKSQSTKTNLKAQLRPASRLYKYCKVIPWYRTRRWIKSLGKIGWCCPMVVANTSTSGFIWTLVVGGLDIISNKWSSTPSLLSVIVDLSWRRIIMLSWSVILRQQIRRLFFLFFLILFLSFPPCFSPPPQQNREHPLSYLFVQSFHWKPDFGASQFQTILSLKPPRSSSSLPSSKQHKTIRKWCREWRRGLHSK